MDALLDADQKAGEKICEYIYELFFYEIAAVKPVIINVLCYTILFMVFSRLIFWRQDYVYNVSFLFMYASVISMLMASFFVLSDVARAVLMCFDLSYSACAGICDSTSCVRKRIFCIRLLRACICTYICGGVAHKAGAHTGNSFVSGA